jgi:hypothetical protein
MKNRKLKTKNEKRKTKMARKTKVKKTVSGYSHLVKWKHVSKQLEQNY